MASILKSSRGFGAVSKKKKRIITNWILSLTFLMQLYFLSIDNSGKFTITDRYGVVWHMTANEIELSSSKGTKRYFDMFAKCTTERIGHMTIAGILS